MYIQFRETQPIRDREAQETSGERREGKEEGRRLRNADSRDIPTDKKVTF